MSRNDYKVTSSTSRMKEGRPDLCWMDIPGKKLDLAVSIGNDFRLVYHHYVEGVYAYSYVYTLPASLLKTSLQKFKLNISLDANQSRRYHVYLHYPTGELYTSYTISGEKICQLNPAFKCMPARLGSYSLESMKTSFSGGIRNVLMSLVASTAVFAPKSAVQEQDPKNFIYVRRKSGDLPKGHHVLGKKNVIYDDNTHPNRLIKAAVQKYHGFSIAPEEYSVCHIWEGSCYKEQYHTDLRNLVLLPRALASLSDYNQDVADMLKYRAYELFDKWHPKEEPAPQAPAGYKSIPWLNLPFDARK